MTTGFWKRFGTMGLGLVVGAALGVGADRAVQAQQSGIKRTPLVTVDEPGTATHEAVMGLAEIPAGGSSGRHFHHGVEMGYVLEGTLTIEHQGRPPQTVKAGEAFKIDANAAHESKTGGVAAKIVTVHMVEKGKPLAEPVK